MERETVNYNGQNYHRYPDSKRPQHRNYFFRHDKWNESPVSLHRQIYEDHHGPIPKGKQIHHKDGNFLNNSIENLECLSAAEHRRAHPASEETREKFRANSERRQPLAKWRNENPELAKETYRENGRNSKGIENWRKNNPNEAHAMAQKAGKLSAEARAEKGIDTSVNLKKWREDNPELAKEMSRQNGIKNTSLAAWQKDNPELVRSKLNQWRENNPEMAREHARAAGKKGAEARAKKRISLQSDGS